MSTVNLHASQVEQGGSLFNKKNCKLAGLLGIITLIGTVICFFHSSSSPTCKTLTPIGLVASAILVFLGIFGSSESEALNPLNSEE